MRFPVVTCMPMHICRPRVRNVITALLNGLGRQHFYNCQPDGYCNVGCRLRVFDPFLTCFSFSCRLLNANKIHCVRVNVFHDLENLSLLSLYDNKIQTLAKGTFAPLKSIQTLYEAFDVQMQSKCSSYYKHSHQNYTSKSVTNK